MKQFMVAKSFVFAVTATGAKSGNFYGGAGGTVNLTAAVLRGEGDIATAIPARFSGSRV